MSGEPFRIEGPALISFSGGRTSAYMLWRILEAHGGALPGDAHVVFANTGKERAETLLFVGACARAWSVPVTWLEYRPNGFEVVGENSASRNGEPFNALIQAKGFLPQVTARFCTDLLKVRPLGQFMRAQGYEHWLNVVGLRADEPRRVAKGRARNAAGKDRWESIWPLHAAGVKKADVLEFWRRQPFDLGLLDHEGNCDLCFLKGKEKRSRIMFDRPDLATWWLDHEAAAGQTFGHPQRPTYAQVFLTRRRQESFDFDEDELDGCLCGEGT